MQMKSMTIKDSYPIQTLELKKIESKFPTTKEAVSYLEKQIEEHPVAVHIATFDHFMHTKSLPDHEMDESVVDIKNVVFCFGKELPVPQLAAVRPRSIAVVEYADRFVISFMDAPNPQAHEAMEKWVKGIKK